MPKVTLRQAAEAIVTHCYNRRDWTRQNHVDFTERQLMAAEERGRRKALVDLMEDRNGS